MEAQLPTDTPLFHQPWWLDATGLPWQMATVRKGDVISGIWPYFPQKKYGVSLLRNPPLCPYLGPYVAFPSHLKPTRQDSFERQIVAALLEQLPQTQVVNTALLPGIAQLDLFAQKGFRIKPRQTFLMNLKATSEAELLSRLQDDYRRNVRRAADELQISNAPEYLEDLYRFSAINLARKGLKPHFSFPYLQNLFNAAHQRGQGALWVARKAGQPEALIWHIWDNRRAYYMMAARLTEAKEARALTALIFHAMMHSWERGIETFDFEGSMDPGVAHFFRGFGGRKELYLVLEKEASLLWRLKNQLL